MNHLDIRHSTLDQSHKGSQITQKRRESVNYFHKYFSFSGLVITTIVSLLLIASDRSNYSVSGDSYTTLSKYRASAQIAVQLISASFGFLQQSVLCQLFNYHTRLRIRTVPPTLDALYAWNSISAARPAWGLRFKFFLPTALFTIGTLVPAALWAGAITPTTIVTQASGTILIPVPQFKNAVNVREWPSEIDASGPLLRNSRGLFTFSPGVKLLGSLLTSAATATTVDGGIRQHAKFDNTRYTYNGRSFGAGASAGLADDSISANLLALSYTYLENSLRPDVQCIHNLSTQFLIEEESLTNIYPVRGYLPNSGDSESYSEYYGHSSDAIVAIGVTNNNASSERILGIAAGSSYAALNTTQCTFHFVPKCFNVSVDLLDHAINVTEVSEGSDFAASANLTYALVRQFELISNDQTSLYVSLLGDSFNSSIANYNSSIVSNSTHPAPSHTAATLAGLTNSIAAMAEDLLVAYNSAQLTIMNDTSLVRAKVQIHAFRYGSSVYIYISFAINTAIILLLIEESIRTRAWRNMLYFDYMDPRTLIVGASMGGCRLAVAAKEAWTDRSRPLYQYRDMAVGTVRVALHENHNALVLDTLRSTQKELPGIVNNDSDS